MRRGYRVVSGILIALGILWLADSRAWAKDVAYDVVVKISVKKRYPDPYRPWTKSDPTEVVGSGVIVEGNRILTNAHIAGYASQIFVQPNLSTKKYLATAQVVVPGLDLALITVDNKDFFKGRKPLPLDKTIPKVRDKVTVYGYPIGGDQLSTTQGIISRIEYCEFTQFTTALRIQVDAALNPGNSGGPAVVDGKIVGLSFSGLQTADNIGYLIAADEIAQFLDDVADGKYDGKPQLDGEVLAPAENEALRDKLGMTEEDGGLVVWEPSLGQSIPSPLKPWDVITHVGDHRVDQHGLVTVRDDLRLSLEYLVPRLAKNGTVRIKVIREGKRIEVDVPAPRKLSRVIPYLDNTYPRYFIHGPLVFSTVSQEAVESLGGAAEPWMRFKKNPILRRQFDPPAFAGEELVMLAHELLPHRISKGYEGTLLPVVDQINGTKVKNLAHLVELIRDAKGEFLTITFQGRYPPMVFRRQALLDATEDILSDEGIRNQCSPDLKPIWEGKKK
ncbi:MAG: trypsin-like peptidase domain-containing protein [Pirellulales bacterium]|nr:trypsin-like peptidase domain-containing protein [Pirellulales bacterium]